MAYVTYKNRNSRNYRFTIDTLNDPTISELKEMLTNENIMLNRINKKLGFKKYPTYGIRIRPRGPRKGNSTGLFGVYYDTPIQNATHFDVYVREYA